MSLEGTLKVSESQRIAKTIAQAGICSRREAEKLIEQGKVKVNNKVITSPALNVSERDEIMVHDKLLNTKAKTTRLFIYHKPQGLVCTRKDEQDRPTIFDRLPQNLPRLINIGRLDLNSEGLLLLTTDGDLAQKMMRPQTGLKRTYRVRAIGHTTQKQLDKLRRGLRLEDERFRPMEIDFLHKDEETKSEGKNVWYQVTLTEGKNREIRRAFEAINLKVNRLLRLSYGPFELGDIPRGEVAEISQHKLKKFMATLK